MYEDGEGSNNNTTARTSNSNSNDHIYNVLYWSDVVGIPFIEADTKNKFVYVKDWPNIDFSRVNFRERAETGVYDNGIALVLGRTLSGELYSFALDFDGEDAVLAWFGSWDGVLQAAEKTRIEWHQDKWRLHHIFFLKRPIDNKKIHIKNSLLEIRCEDQLLFAWPSMNKSGSQYTPLGTDKIAILDEMQLRRLEAMIDSFSANYVSDEKGNRGEYIRWLENARLGEGEGRHNGLVILGTSFYYRYANSWLHFTDDQRKAKLWEWNLKQKVPKPEKEFNQVWNWIVEHHRRERDRKHEEIRNDKRRNLFTDMPGCISYKINSNPDRYIVGTPDNKIVEIECKWIQNKQNPGTLTMIRIQNKTFTACKPTKIIKHKNPLSFLEIRQKYTIEFQGSEQSGNFTIRHKTLSEIISELKNGNALSENGLDIAITAQIKGFEERGLLEISDSMDYTGFFTTEEGKSIMISNLEIKQEPINVSDSLNYIDELSKYFEGRLDLLAHILLFAMIAPCSFIFKVIGAPLLEWMHPYGNSNAGKSSSGKIVLAADGNENNDDFNLSFGHVDTIARFGETVSKTTFPKLVDEVDLTDSPKLISNIKSAVDQIRFRKTLDRNRSVEYSPALTPLILTSNPSPPLDDPSYLKRVTVRYFGKEEIHFPDDRVAIEYKNFLAANLHRERAIGHFRNKFIMDNQALILDKRLTPFQKARMIWKAAYQSARLGMPDWLLNNQLEQTHMRESVEDSKGSIRSALEGMIIEKCRSLDNEILRTPGYETTDRLVILVDRRLVPYIKKLLIKDYAYFLFYRPIILELRDRFGVTKDQLPNLKALVDFIPGSVYIQHNGYWTAKTSLAKLQEYFGEKVTANTQETLT